MSEFENAIKAALINAGSSFPEVQGITTGQTRPEGSTLYILINADDLTPIEAGEALKQPVKQAAQVSLLGVISRDDQENTVKEIVETAGGKVFLALKENMRLSSTVYPDGFLVCNLSFGDIQADFSMHEQNSVYFQNISIEGEFFK
ncbi:MAG: hypothetical protein PVH61_13865 [Candidatus Aminicenantes bacterium]|jgi:hypothetical protein